MVYSPAGRFKKSMRACLECAGSSALIWIALSAVQVEGGGKGGAPSLSML